MKKTITINISGLVFNIEEDAYSSLKNYLEKIGNKFNNLEERQEIIEDIEARVAELFTEKIDRNKEVINQKDVNRIIEVMGSPDNFEEEESEFKDKTESKSTTTNEKKKFFRDPDNKVLGGVCAGISNYFGWDISILRVIFALSVLLLGTGFWLYIILWILIPEAKSTSDKLAMEGKNANINNIKTFFTKFKSDINNIDTSSVNKNIKKQSDRFNDFLVGTSKRINETVRPKERISRFFTSIFSILGFIFISMGLVLIFSLAYGLIMPENSNQIKTFLDEIYSNVGLKPDDMLAIIISVCTLAFSIGIGLIILGIRFAFTNNKELITKINPIGTAARFMIILSIISTIALVALNTKLHLSKVTYNTTEELNYKTIVIKKMSSPAYYDYSEKIEFNIEKSSADIPYLNIKKKALGLHSNKINSRKVYDFEIKDSIVSLSPTLNYDKNFFEEQEIEITLFIPNNDSTTIINEFD